MERGHGPRAWYCRRVVVLGAESTGTSTLAADLAEHLGTVSVPEYGRQFSAEHGLGHSWSSRDQLTAAATSFPGPPGW
jgi:HTH-type transcriptional regulator, transcriptional repressor of NAD biosynthesis genes